MSRISRTINWIRKNPKKSIFFGGAIGFGSNYALEKRRKPLQTVLGSLSKSARNLRRSPQSMLRRFSVTVRRNAVEYLSVRSLSSRLDDAAKRLKTLKEEPENDVKLQIYALYKQATVGDVNIPKPGSFDFVGKVKWVAWKKIEGTPKEKAEDEYVSLVDSLLQSEQKSEGPSVVMDAVPGIVKTLENGVLTVRLDRVEKKNAMTLDMYRNLTKTINEAATNNAVNFFVFTGTGDFFSSGNDLGNFIEKLKTGADIQEMAVDSAHLVLEYVRAFIDFPKPMIALVNGPSIGIGCTILGLFDLVYASDKAYFQTPFSQLGLNPEGCSSYTFPLLFGAPLAGEVLLMNRKITAAEALKARFVTDVFPADSYEAECKKRVDYISKQPPKSLMYSKMLIRNAHRDALIKANIDECKRLEERFTSDEAMTAVANFFKSKGSKMLRLIMRAYCHEAMAFGDQLCPQGSTPRHVTVIMNSHTKGSKALYEDYAAPLLHLAGVKISLFKTEHSGQAKDLMQIMDNTDAVLIVGGDGTLMEAVTGLLSRDDRMEACHRFPLGVIPTGRTNTLAKRLYYNEEMKHQQLAAAAAMALIKDVKQPIDAFRVDFHNEKLWDRDDDEAETRLRAIQEQDLQAQGIAPKSNNSKEVAEVGPDATDSTVKKPYLRKVDPVFGVAKLECGIFRDIDARIDRYWYFGGLRAKAAYFFGSLRQNPQPEETEIRYSDVCPGCNKCMVMPPKVQKKETNEDKQPQRWWGSFVKKEQAQSSPVDPYEKFANVVNENCGSSTDTSICYTNIELVPEGGGLTLKASPATLGASTVLLDGFKRHSQHKTPCLEEQLRVGRIQFNFPQKELVDPEYIPTAEEMRSKELFIKGKKMAIDSEVFARQPISVTLYPRAVNFFVSS